MSGNGDYISREAAIELLSQPITMSMCLSVEECHHKIAQQCIDRYLVENIPDADVRPVVMCRDCKYWFNAPVADGFNSCELDALIRHEDFFCAAGEKREEN